MKLINISNVKNNKKITVKYCLFTKDLDEARILARLIKNTANDELSRHLTTKHPNLKSLTSLINIKRQNEHKIKQERLYLDVSEYKKISQSVIAKFYNVSISVQDKSEIEVTPNNKQEKNKTRLICAGWSQIVTSLQRLSLT